MDGSEKSSGADTPGKGSAHDPTQKGTVWLAALPLVWLVWELLATLSSVDRELSWPTLKHFGACVACFYLGYFCLSQISRRAPFWAGLWIGLVLVIAAGFGQHFGGLEETRRYFYLYVYPRVHDVPEDYLKKLSSPRIFGTLFYPNALAGCFLLLLPPLTVAFWRLLLQVWWARKWMTDGARLFVMGLMTLAGLAFVLGAMACLYWSGSKGGWLLMLILILIGILKLQVGKRLKLMVIGVLLVTGLAGFIWKHSAFFQKGATSVVARFDYWRAALHVTAQHPLLGTGPGTFAIPYEQIKKPESEMARLVHNDYLEQASDSGIPAALIFSLLVVVTLAKSFPRVASSDCGFALWLGVLGWSCQSLMEFGLYIPSLAWPAFTFLGVLVSFGGQVDGTESINVNAPP